MEMLLTRLLMLLAGCANQEPEMRTSVSRGRYGAVQNVRVGGAVLDRCRTAQDRQLELKVRAVAERRQRIGYEAMLQAANRSW